MSLVKSPDLTPEKLAANQANARQSQGPATPEGVERIRAANTRHGYYRQAPSAGMQLLGENPEEFEALFESLVATWQPQNDFETSLVRRMARLMWRLERSDRVQEAMLVYQMESLDRGLAREKRQQAAAHERVISRLKALVERLDANKFCSTETDLRGMQEIYGKMPVGGGYEIMSRVYRLLPPGVRESMEAASAAADPKNTPGPDLAVALGTTRDVLRAELRALLREEIRWRNEEYEAKRADLDKDTGGAYRDSMLLPRHPQAGLLLRSGDSDLRQLRFVIEMLTKLKSGSSKPAPADAEGAKVSECPMM
ncbi:MAG TPA: hypothetical protein VI455_19500 [Terriglobia bacterium]